MVKISKIIIYNQKKKSGIKTPKKDDSNELKIEIKNSNKIINENILGYKLQLTPILSHKFYYKKYDPDDFPEKKQIQTEYINLITDNFSVHDNNTINLINQNNDNQSEK